MTSSPGASGVSPGSKDLVVGLSSSSVYPEPLGRAFEYAVRLGYDAVEVMVSIDSVSQDVDAVRHLVDYHGIGVCAVHAPCLLVTQRVWGTDPWEKLRRSAAMAETLGADTVVVHPPFRWQRDYARGFVDGIAQLEEQTGISFAVENMYPWRATQRPRTDGGQRGVQVYQPGWDPSEQPYAHTTVDLSHTATAQADPVEMARRLGDRLHHVHLADGVGSPKDEHLVPGRGTQPCAEFLGLVSDSNFSGAVVVEINTRRCSRRERESDLAESLAFARLHTGAPEVGASP